MKDYLGKVEAASNGKIKTEVFESGQLYPDLEVGKALIQGQVEMAAPGSWTITGIVSDADCFQLPVLYGQPIDLIHRVIDGKPGQYLNGQIQQKLRSHVLGPYLDLGFQNWYSSNKPIASLADLKGMKIRNSGGAGQAWRARFLGAIPNTTAWPNVPLALSQGTFDGLVQFERKPGQRQTLGLRRQIRAGGSPVHRRIHSAAEPGVLGQALARPAEDDDRHLGAERPDLPRQHGRRPDQGAHHAGRARHQVLRSDRRSRAPRSARR